jgi:hypothetical protein
MMKIPVKNTHQSNSLESSQDSNGVKVISKKVINFQTNQDEYCFDQGSVDRLKEPQQKRGGKQPRLISGHPQRRVAPQE